jgi:hypothetical protein
MLLLGSSVSRLLHPPFPLMTLRRSYPAHHYTCSRTTSDIGRLHPSASKVAQSRSGSSVSRLFHSPPPLMMLRRRRPALQYTFGGPLGVRGHTFLLGSSVLRPLHLPFPFMTLWRCCPACHRMCCSYASSNAGMRAPSLPKAAHSAWLLGLRSAPTAATTHDAFSILPRVPQRASCVDHCVSLMHVPRRTSGVCLPRLP